jgi:hypothetical protein
VRRDAVRRVDGSGGDRRNAEGWTGEGSDRAPIREYPKQVT